MTRVDQYCRVSQWWFRKHSGACWIHDFLKNVSAALNIWRSCTNNDCTTCTCKSVNHREDKNSRGWRWRTRVRERGMRGVQGWEQIGGVEHKRRNGSSTGDEGWPRARSRRGNEPKVWGSGLGVNFSMRFRRFIMPRVAPVMKGKEVRRRMRGSVSHWSVQPSDRNSSQRSCLR